MMRRDSTCKLPTPHIQALNWMPLTMFYIITQKKGIAFPRI